MRIGVIGTGAMGAHLVRRLVVAGAHDVLAHDRDAAAMSAATDAGAGPATSARDLAGVSDVVIVTVGGRGASEIAADVAAAMPAGSILVLAGTLDPEEARSIGEHAASVGIAVVDGPLGGGEPGVRDGTATAFLGGDASPLRIVDDVYRCFTRERVNCGPVGAGQVVKLANNLLLWSAVAATVEAMELAARLGVDPATLRTAMLEGPGRSWALETWDRPRTMPWADEDLAIALDVAAAVGADVPHTRLIRESMARIQRTRLDSGHAGSSLAEWTESTLGAPRLAAGE